MQKYSNLIWGGLVFLAALAVIVWIIREQNETVEGAIENAAISPDENVEPLNGLAPLNTEQVIASANLTYNVPQPGNVAPISSNQDYLTQGQSNLAGINTADWTISNLLAVNLPATDFQEMN